MTKIIRSSKHSLKFANKGKLEKLFSLIEDSANNIQKFTNILWNNFNPLKEELPPFPEMEFCNKIKSNRIKDSKLRQCNAKQALGIVRSSTEKPRKRLYKLKELQKEEKDTKYLQRKISLNKTNKPTFTNHKINLDSRFIDFKFKEEKEITSLIIENTLIKENTLTIENKKLKKENKLVKENTFEPIKNKNEYFDVFIQISEIGNNQEYIRIPIKHTKVSRYLLKQGFKLSASIKISKEFITLYFELEKPPKKSNGVKRGGDQGCITCLSISDGQQTQKCPHGHDLDSILKKTSRKKHGSKAMKRAIEHQNNYIGYSLKRLNYDYINKINFEGIKDLKRGKVNSKYIQHWNYPLIEHRLVCLGEIKGFEVTTSPNKFKSQRCSKCGWTHKSNRKGKTFKCLRCEFKSDSDLNASSNHEIELFKLPEWVWSAKINRSGFFWDCFGFYSVSHEFIVRDCSNKVMK